MKDESLELNGREAIRGVTCMEFVLRSSETATIETFNEHRLVVALNSQAHDAFALEFALVAASGISSPRPRGTDYEVIDL